MVTVNEPNALDEFYKRALDSLTTEFSRAAKEHDEVLARMRRLRVGARQAAKVHGVDPPEWAAVRSRRRGEAKQ